MTKQPVAFDFGAFRVTPLSDGYAWMANTVFPDFDPGLAGASARGRFCLTIAAFLICAPGLTLLVDTGSAGNFGPEASHFPASFAHCGVAADAVDAVFLTHLHSDHYGGLLAGDGAPRFPQARLILSETEWQQVHDRTLDGARAPDVRARVDRARQAVAPYAVGTALVRAGAELAPGLRVLALPGHTPGHCGLALSHGRQKLLVLGDVIHCAAYQLPHPDWSVIYDDDPGQAAATRRAVLTRAAREGCFVLGAHLNRGGLTRIETEGQGFCLADIGCGA